MLMTDIIFMLAAAHLTSFSLHDFPRWNNLFTRMLTGLSRPPHVKSIHLCHQISQFCVSAVCGNAPLATPALSGVEKSG